MAAMAQTVKHIKKKAESNVLMQVSEDRKEWCVTIASNWGLQIVADAKENAWWGIPSASIDWTPNAASGDLHLINFALRAQSLHSPPGAGRMLGRPDAAAGAGSGGRKSCPRALLPRGPQFRLLGGRQPHARVFLKWRILRVSNLVERHSSCTANFLWPNATHKGEFSSLTPGTR
jgi:hypothetical protein